MIATAGRRQEQTTRRFEGQTATLEESAPEPVLRGRGAEPEVRLQQEGGGVKIQLSKLAHARSGDKGDTANIGVIAYKPEYYPVLVEGVTVERVKEHFQGICQGEVERFELPNIGAVNFLLHQSLGGGGTVSLRLDAQGKTLSAALLRMEIEVPDETARMLLDEE